MYAKLCSPKLCSRWRRITLGGVVAERLAGRSRARRIALAMVIAALGTTTLAAGQALGDSFYVSPTGSDSNPGTALLPWRTITHAASLAGAGSTVVIEAGNYGETVTLTHSGFAGEAITFKAANRERPSVRALTVAGSYVNVTGLTISGARRDCVAIEPGLTHVALRGNTITQCGRDGIHFVRSDAANYTSQAIIAGNSISAVGLALYGGNDMTIYGDRVLVLGNDITGTSNDAIDMWGERLSFRQNRIHDIGSPESPESAAFHTWTGAADGIEGEPVTNLLMAQNRITNVVGKNAHGILAVGTGDSEWSVFDNIFDNIAGVGVGFEASNGYDLDTYENTLFDAGESADAAFGPEAKGSFVDNIVMGGGGVRIANARAVTEDYNLLYRTSASTNGPHDINSNPALANPLTGNFNLEPASPAIDAGDNGTLIPVRPYDFAGNRVVGINDIGAYEYQPQEAEFESGGGGGGSQLRGAQVHSLWPSVSPSEMTAELNSLKNAGANVLRVDVGWGSLETAKGQYDPTYLGKLDALASDARARGMKLIATLWWTPQWASASGSPYAAPTYPADYGDFARFITARYGTELAAVEAWNEPNWNNNLIALNVPLAYTRMVKAFYTGAKQGNPEVAVLVGSMCYADLAFLGQLYLDGIKGYYDGISLHPYADGASPENKLVAHSFIGQIEKMHAFQLLNGDSTPEWLTEFGWPTGTSPGANTEAQQAAYTEKAFALVGGLRYVAGATLYQLRDMASNPEDPEDNFGLLHRNFTQRPSYAAFTKALHTAPTG